MLIRDLSSDVCSSDLLWHSVHIGAQGYTLKKCGGERTENEGLVPPMAAALMRFEAKFEGHAAKDQTQQHENKRQHECATYDGVSQWESRQQARTAQSQPGIVAVQDRRPGLHHDVPVRSEGRRVWQEWACRC